MVGSGEGSGPDVTVVGASPAAGPGTALGSSVSGGVEIAVAAAAGGLVGTNAVGVADATSTAWLGPEPNSGSESELHAATANTIKDNAVPITTRPDRRLRRIDASIIATSHLTPYSFCLALPQLTVQIRYVISRSS